MTVPGHHQVRKVRSARGAVTVFLPFRFPGPPPEPGVRVSSHPALHKRRWSAGCLEFGPWCRDVASVVVAPDHDASGFEHCDAAVLRPLPVGGVVLAPQGLPVCLGVLRRSHPTIRHQV